MAAMASPPKHPGHQLGISRRKRRRHGDGGMGSLWAESCSRLDQNWPAWLDGWLDGWMDGWMMLDGWMDGWLDYQSSSFTEGSVVNVISQV